MKKKRTLKPLNEVHIFDPKHNPMFPNWLTARLLFLRYQAPVKCAYCGRMNRHHWTLLLAFKIMEGFEKKIGDKVVPACGLVGTDGKQTFLPLTPVCRKHILNPIV